MFFAIGTFSTLMRLVKFNAPALYPIIKFCSGLSLNLNVALFFLAILLTPYLTAHNIFKVSV